MGLEKIRLNGSQRHTSPLVSIHRPQDKDKNLETVQLSERQYRALKIIEKISSLSGGHARTEQLFREIVKRKSHSKVELYKFNKKFLVPLKEAALIEQDKHHRWHLTKEGEARLLPEKEARIEFLEDEVLNLLEEAIKTGLTRKDLFKRLGKKAEIKKIEDLKKEELELALQSLINQGEVNKTIVYWYEGEMDISQEQDFDISSILEKLKPDEIRLLKTISGFTKEDLITGKILLGFTGKKASTREEAFAFNREFLKPLKGYGLIEQSRAYKWQLTTKGQLVLLPQEERKTKVIELEILTLLQRHRSTGISKIALLEELNKNRSNGEKEKVKKADCITIIKNLDDRLSKKVLFFLADAAINKPRIVLPDNAIAEPEEDIPEEPETGTPYATYNIVRDVDDVITLEDIALDVTGIYLKEGAQGVEALTLAIISKMPPQTSDQLFEIIYGKKMDEDPERAVFFLRSMLSLRENEKIFQVYGNVWLPRKRYVSNSRFSRLAEQLKTTNAF